MNNKTKKIANFVSEISFEKIPEKTVEKAKLCLIDELACALVGSRTNSSRLISELMTESDKGKEAVILNRKGKFSALNAADLNTIFAAASGISGTHLPSSSHVSRGVIFASLASAEKEKIKGKKLITAIIAGYEIGARVAMALGPQATYRRGFHPSEFAWSFGSVACSGKIFKLNEEQLVDSLGLTELSDPRMKSHLFRSTPFWVRKYGQAVKSGMFASLLAKRGSYSYKGALDDEKGFYAIFSDDYKPSKLVEELGNRYAIENHHFKKYAVCQYMEPIIEGLPRDLGEKEINKVVVEVTPTAYDLISGTQIPKTRHAAIMSGRYLIAVAILRKNLFTEYDLEGYLKKMRENPTVIKYILKAMKKIKIKPKKSLTNKFETDIRIESNDSQVEKHVELDPEKSMSEKELKTKFISITKPFLEKKKRDEILEIISNLEGLNNTSLLMKAFQK